MGEIIDGKAVADKIREKIKEEVSGLQKKPGLAVIIVGDDEASKVYVGIKQKACREAGIEYYKYEFDKDVTEREILTIIKTLNKDKKINGILVQMPLPKHIDKKKILESVDPVKDVDCFHPVNAGAIFLGDTSGFVPATPKGVMKLLESSNAELEGKHAVVVGRSTIVGKPVSVLLLEKNCTVTVCHSRTKELSKHTSMADILVAAVGKPKFITKRMVKKGAVVVDVGVNRVSGKLVGDVDFDAVKKKASLITPVPRGVGPMTIAMLLENVMIAYRGQHK